MRLMLASSTLLLCLLANAQITITSADMPAVGDTFQLLRDNSPAGFSIGQSGPNRIWDFSNLQPDEQLATYAVAPSSTPYSSDFPNANLALTNDFSFYLYYRNTSTALKAEGFANNDPNLGVVSVNFNPIPDQYKFPATYQTNFAGSTGFQEAKPYNQLPANIQQQINAALQSFPGASVSQVRVTFTSSYKDTIDAWGTVITPIGSYDALRRKRIENSNTKIEAQVTLIFPPTTFWQEISNTNSNTTEHSWLSTVTKIPLISLGYDSLRNINAVTYSTTPPPPVAGFTWNNPLGGLINFANTSQNNPTSYNWDFGDGASSVLQDPSHIYSANGSYYVCLTVANVSGSDTFCDSVFVTEIDTVNHPPIAVRDSAYTISPNKVQIDALGNDYDPDGDSVIYVIFTSALNGNVSRLLSGLFEYSPNIGFSGIDSFEYIIRDNGNPSLRDTGTVVVRVDALPFASFVYTTTGLNVQFESTSTGFDLLSWDLGDGATDTGSVVTHTYVSGIYNVCLTATNSVGSDDTCRTIDLSGVGITSVKNSYFHVFPNPAANVLRVESGDLDFYKVEVINSDGKILIANLAKHNTESLFLDISSLPMGFYVCKLTEDDGHVSVAKFVKE